MLRSELEYTLNGSGAVGVSGNAGDTRGVGTGNDRDMNARINPVDFGGVSDSAGAFGPLDVGVAMALGFGSSPAVFPTFSGV